MKAFLISSFVTLIGLYGFDFLKDAGQFKTITPHFAGQCQVIKGVTGAEDISFLPNGKYAIISGYDRRSNQSDNSAESGIYLYNLDNKNLTKISPDSNTENKQFKPHGISLYHFNGRTRLFVINHANQQHVVDIFDLIDNKLHLYKTIEGPELISPNDLVAVGPEQFYASNDHHYKKGFKRTLEDYLRLPLSNVVFFDGEKFSEAVGDIQYANGINVSHDGQLLYLNSITSGDVHIYNRNLENNALNLQQIIHTGTGVDNIELDEKGNLWIGAHPQLLKFVGHAKDKNKLAPSQVIKISPVGDRYKTEEVYLNLGEQLSASSVAAVSGKRMLIGAVFDDHFLDCTL